MGAPGEILKLLAAAPASIQALAARLGDDAPTMRRKIYALAADGLVEGAGKGEANQQLWRVKAAPDAVRPNKGGRRAKDDPPSPSPPRRMRPPRMLKPGEGWSRHRIRPADDAGRAPQVVQLRPMTAERRRFCGWFLAAGWPAHEVAWLFDVRVEALDR